MGARGCTLCPVGSQCALMCFYSRLINTRLQPGDAQAQTPLPLRASYPTTYASTMTDVLPVGAPLAPYQAMYSPELKLNFSPTESSRMSLPSPQTTATPLGHFPAEPLYGYPMQIPPGNQWNQAPSY